MADTTTEWMIAATWPDHREYWNGRGEFTSNRCDAVRYSEKSAESFSFAYNSARRYADYLAARVRWVRVTVRRTSPKGDSKNNG